MHALAFLLAAQCAAALHLPHASPVHVHVRAGLRTSAPSCVAEPPDPVEEAPPPLSPQAAVEELGSLLEQVKLLWTEGRAWSAEERVARRRELVSTYVRVFAPAMAFSATQLGLTLGEFLVLLFGLNVSGRGYADVAGLVSGVPFLRDALTNVDPSWGNAAIALVLVEVSAPVLLPVSAALTPRLSDKLQAQLTEWGLDADGLNARIEKVLEQTS